MIISISYGEFNDSNFQELLDYLVHVNKKHTLQKLIVHPSYFAENMLKQFNGVWYDIRLSSCIEKGFNRLEYGNLQLEVIVCSVMNGKWCVI